VTHPDHAFITMLRDPVGNFESEFGFFRDYPFPQWVGENGTIIDFMKNPSGYYNKKTPWYMR
jgi:galactosylceramide sulfotransferase